MKNTLFKSILALTISTCMLLSVVGCDNSQSGNNDNGNDNSITKPSGNMGNQDDTYEKNGIIYVGEETNVTVETTVKNFGDFSSESDEKAAELRTEILEAKDTIKVKGTTWYLSNNGDDSNDGNSPEKPWKTLNALSINAYKIKAGDAVLFERGDIFRGNFNTVSGVSYGAYGSGNKPAIYGSKQNYAEEVWRRTSEKNIYALIYTSTADVGMLVFNHGEARGSKKLKKVFECDEDYEFYQDKEAGVLYLYCSKGNPGKVFYDIEILQNKSIISIPKNSENVYIENLSLKYTGAFGISGGMPIKGITIKNCEIGWIGGSIHKAASNTRYGNGIQFYGQTTDAIVDHCWIYQVYDAGLTHQYTGGDNNNPEMNATNISYTNNLLEFCAYSLEYFWNWKVNGVIVDNPNIYMKDILVENNIMRFAGYGLSEDRPDPINMGHVVTAHSYNRSINFIVKNNIFDQSKLRLFAIRTATSVNPKFTDNTYIQKEGGKLGETYINGKKDTPAIDLNQASLKTFDPSGKLVIVK